MLNKVIHSLEDQIDGLLVDLKSANDALQAKDHMFNDLEQLVAHHESERDILEKKLQSITSRCQEVEERLRNQASWKEAAEIELANLRDGLDMDNRIVSASCKEDKQIAGRYIAKLAENHSTSVKAAAFRQWACQTSAIRAVAKQSHAAAALAAQLELTREKMVSLKRRMKKNRKGRGNGGLDSIVEEEDKLEL